LDPLFSAVSNLNSNSASTASTILRWLSLFPSEGTNKLALLCASLTSVIALCGPLRRPDNLFDQFPTFVIISTLF